MLTVEELLKKLHKARKGDDPLIRQLERFSQGTEVVGDPDTATEAKMVGGKVVLT